MKYSYALLIAAAIMLALTAQAGYAQYNPVFYGHMSPDLQQIALAPSYTFYSFYQGPFYEYYLGAGVYFFEPFTPPGYVFSQPNMGLPLISQQQSFNGGGPTLIAVINQGQYVWPR
jgi:hypothetical protein